MRERYEPPTQYAWIVYAVAMMMFGGLAGYIIAIESGRSAAAAVYSGNAPPPAAASVDDAQLRAYREILARDPKSVQAAVAAGNLLYDARRYPEAIGFYEQAFALNGSDINVSTDLGTALWYSGRADAALAQYQKSLAIDASHGQTLFNVGIVRADGKQDYVGAVEAWETLLRTNPAYPEAARVRTLISDAKAKMR